MARSGWAAQGLRFCSIVSFIFLIATICAPWIYYSESGVTSSMTLWGMSTCAFSVCAKLMYTDSFFGGAAGKAVAAGIILCLATPLSLYVAAVGLRMDGAWDGVASLASAWCAAVLVLM